MAGEEEARKTLLLGTILIFAVVSFFIVKPFILTVISSMVLGYIFYPFYVWLKKILRSPNLSAGIISLFIFLIIFIPLWFVIPTLVRQTFAIYTTIQNVDFVGPLIKVAPQFFTSTEFTRDFTVSVNSIVIRIANSVVSRFEIMITELPLILTNLVVLLFVFFFTLRDNEKIISFLKDLSPFSEETEKKFTKHFNDVTKSIIYGMVIVGSLQGLMAGIGFYAFGISQALLLTIFAVLFGILPVLGPFMIWVPIGITLISQGKIFLAIAFFIYNLITTILVNFFIGPKIVEKRSGMPQVIALIGMLGGGYFLGIIGLVIGPLVLGYFLLLLEFYRNKKIHEIFNLCK
ncbi:MAG: AI-2E family transporter [archaeon]